MFGFKMLGKRFVAKSAALQALVFDRQNPFA
jgi:hypothetical protein